jgi:nucleoside-diphosphate-sugar epimerase
VTVLITGGNGFVGSHLASWFRARGYEVTIGTRNPTGPGEMFLRLGRPFDVEQVQKCDIVVHAAHDFHSQDDTVNGTLEVFRAAQSRARQVFVSSYSARPDALSEYGRTKYKLERVFLQQGQQVIRPGLVIGNGGMFARNARTVLVLPLVPVINGGSDEVPVIAIADAVEGIGRIVKSQQPGEWNLFYPQMPQMKCIIRTIAQCAGVRRLLVPVPEGIALAAIRILSMMSIPLPFDPDNVRSIQANRVRVHASNLLDLGIESRSLVEIISSAIAEIDAHSRNERSCL